MMDLFLYISIFISGTVFGSFFSLAIYRLPRKENITYVRSHCTLCNHELKLLDLIPVWSYLLLGGKCRYCKEKIRSRYILLEIFSGMVFVVLALSLNINFLSTIHEFVELFFTYLFVCALFIIGGIDNENYVIHDGTIFYGIILSLIYGIYNAFLGQSMYDNMIGFFAIPLIFLFIAYITKFSQKIEEPPIGFGDIKYLSLIGLYLGFGLQVISLVLAIFIATIFSIIKKQKKISFGFYLSISTIIVLIMQTELLPVTELINLSL